MPQTYFPYKAVKISISVNKLSKNRVKQRELIILNYPTDKIKNVRIIAVVKKVRNLQRYVCPNQKELRKFTRSPSKKTRIIKIKDIKVASCKDKVIAEIFSKH